MEARGHSPLLPSTTYTTRRDTIQAVIPNNPSRAKKYPLDKDLYNQRHLIECCFSKLKQFRRIATRYEKTARNYRAMIALASNYALGKVSVHDS
jgi:transposase